MGHTKKQVPQGNLLTKGWLGTRSCNHCTQGLCFSAGNEIPLHPATGASQLWVSTLSHWLGQPPFISGSRQKHCTLTHLPCPSDQLPGVGPTSQQPLTVPSFPFPGILPFPLPLLWAARRLFSIAHFWSQLSLNCTPCVSEAFPLPNQHHHP